MELASKIKNSLFTWIFALVISLCLSENSVGENFSYQWDASEKIEAETFEGTKENRLCYWYGVSGYANAPNNVVKQSDELLQLLYDASVVPYQGGKIRNFVTQQDDYYYRVFSGDNTMGGFLTKVKPKSSEWAREALALPPMNQAEMIQKVLVPKGTYLSRSRAAGNAWGRGGAEQFEILQLYKNQFQPVEFGKGVPFK